MKLRNFILGILAGAALAVVAEDAPDTTNTVMMVDQYGNLNVAGVASVSDVATNAANVLVAEAKSEAAMTTARSVTNQLNGIVANIMSNNVVIYRSGYTDAFAGLIVYTDSDKLIITDYEKVSLENGVLTSHIEYVCTVNLGTTKPNVYAHDTLESGTTEFEKVSASNVSTPTVHNESKTVSGVTYDRWYEIDVEIAVAGTASQYFYFIKLEADTPSGDGATLELPNGVTGGITGDYTFGTATLHFVGGVCTGVTNGQ